MGHSQSHLVFAEGGLGQEPLTLLREEKLKLWQLMVFHLCDSELNIM